MITENVEIKTPDGVCDAYAARPGDGKYPAVLLYMDAYGLRPYLEEMAQKIAAHGYFVLVPNLFYREKHSPVVDMKFPLKESDMPAARQQIMGLFQNWKPELGRKDAAAFVDYLAKDKHVHPGKIGTAGYCMGGGLALSTAALFPDRVAAAASFHGGRLAGDAPDSPHLSVNKIKAELYIAHAENDPSMPEEQIEKLRAALDKAHVRYEAETYKGAAHGFTMLDLPHGSRSATDRHWAKLIPLLERNLK
jgi:carboxymethylenebutenolidase